MAESFLPPAVLDLITNAAEFTGGLDDAIESAQAGRDAIGEVTAAAGDMASAMGAAADGAAAAMSSAAGAVADAQEVIADSAKAAADTVTGSSDAIAASSEAMAGTVAASMGTVADTIAAATEASVLSREPLAAYNESLLAAAGAAGDLAVAQAELKATGAELRAAVADLAAAEATAGKGSEEYAAQLNVVADAMLRQQDAAYELRNAQIAAAGATSTAAGEAEAATGQVAALGDAEVIAGKKAAAAGDEQEAASGKASKGLKLWGLAAVAGVAVSVKMAGDFQQSMTRLVTSAGETQGNLALVSQGILDMSSATDTSTSQLASGMYMVESAGIHGASGLAVLKASAEGAQAEGANLSDVTNAMTSAINAYGMKTGTTAQAQKSANTVMNEMLQIVGQGKMTMQDLASSLSAVLPIAAKYHISFAEVGGALATMTSMGMSARQGTDDLANTIRNLGNPTGVATNEMAMFGIQSTTVSQKLGKLGLTGTIGYLSDAITSKMGKSGLVLVKSMNQSKAAAADAQTMLKLLPKSIQGISRAYLDGGASYTTWYNATKGLPLTAKTMADQFASVAGKAHGFNSLLASGSPAAQTYSAAMAKMLGGATGLNVGLMLTGAHASVFNDNVKAIAGSAKSTGDNINNWGLIQKNFNFQLGSAEKAVQAMAISFGSALLPAATAAIHILGSFAGFLARNAAASKILAVVIGVLLAGALTHGLVNALKACGKGFNDLTGAGGKMIGFFKSGEGEASQFGKMMSGIGGAAKSAGSVVAKAWSGTMGALKSVWSSITGAATAAGDAQDASAEATAAVQETAAGEAAAANEAAAAESSGSWAAAAANQIATGAEWAARSAADLAGVVADNLGSAAAAAGGWLAAGAQQVAGAAVWVATSVAKVAVMVAANVAGALTTAAAWVAANAVMLLGIGLIIAAVVIAVVEIVKHWKSIVHGVQEAWDDVYRAVKDAVGAVVGFVKSHWELLLAILLGPIAVAVLEIAKHWKLILHDAEAFAGDVTSTVRKLGSDVLHFFERMFDDLGSAERRGIAVIMADVRRWFVDFVSTEASGIDNIVHFFEQLPGRILHATASFGSLLLSAGKAVVEGLIRGVEDMAGDAIGAVRHLGSDLLGAAKDVLGIFSPSREFAEIGDNIALGLALGITRSSATVLSKTQTLMKDITDAAAQGEITQSQADALGLQLGAAMKAALRQSIGQAVGSSLQAELATVGKSTKATLAALVQIWDAEKGGLITLPEASALAKWVKADNARLLDLAKKRTSIANELAAAQSLATSTSSAAQSSYNLSSAAGTGTSPASVSSIISTLQGDVAQIRQFSGNLRKLARMGLNKAYLSQLISMGPASGGALAAELASSGLGDIQQINAAESAITSASNGLGDAAVSAMYTAGKQSGAGFLAGLKGQEKAIEAVMASIAATMVKKIRKDLGISSPSKVMFTHGQMIAQGLANGIASGVGQVTRAVRGLTAAASLAGTGSVHSAGALSTAAPGGTVDLHLNLRVTGEVSKQELFTANAQETYRYNVRNSGSVTGIVKPGA